MSACPKCRLFDCGATMTRKLRNGWVKRWRKCLTTGGGHTFNTYEVPEGELELDPGDPGLMHMPRRTHATS